MTAKQKDWFDWVAQRGCLVPGCSRPPALHHVSGARSFKTGQKLRRRQYLADWAVVPVCQYHHQQANTSIHNVGEAGFGIEYLGGDTAVLEWAYTLALRYVHEGRNG